MVCFFPSQSQCHNKFPVVAALSIKMLNNTPDHEGGGNSVPSFTEHGLHWLQWKSCQINLNELTLIIFLQMRCWEDMSIFLVYQFSIANFLNAPVAENWGNGFTEQVNSDISLQQNTDSLTEQFSICAKKRKITPNSWTSGKHCEMKLVLYYSFWHCGHKKKSGSGANMTTSTWWTSTEHSEMMHLRAKHVPTCLFTDSRPTVWISSSRESTPSQHSEYNKTDIRFLGI